MLTNADVLQEGGSDSLTWPDGHIISAAPVHAAIANTRVNMQWPGEKAYTADAAYQKSPGWKTLNTEWTWPQVHLSPSLPLSLSLSFSLSLSLSLSLFLYLSLTVFECVCLFVCV
jgi:hypothetical protein